MLLVAFRMTSLRNLGFLFSMAPLGMACDSESEGSETDGSETGDSEPDLVQACATYTDRYAECWGEEFRELAEEGCTNYTTATVAYYGADCAPVHEALLVCVSALACPEFMSGEDRYDGDCADEAEAFNDACGGSL
jgi:hypothetical protein